MDKNFRGRKLIIGFGAFLALTLTIGFIGLLQIYSLSKNIQELGNRYLPRERAVLEMKTSNALYVMGVRNYAFWRITRHLEAAAIASDLESIEKSFSEFKNYLALYQSLAVSAQQRGWARTVDKFSDELYSCAGKIIRFADAENPDAEKVNKFLMLFENKFYAIDEFLGSALSRNNLLAIEKQIETADQKKRTSFFVLFSALFCSVVLGLSISVFEYKSIKDEQKKRQALVHKIVNVEEEERRNLSRQVHDQLGQELSALKIYLGLIGKDISPENSGQINKIEQSKKILSGLIDKSHNISEMLRPPELDELGVSESIAVLISEHRRIRANCNYIYNKPSVEIKLDAEGSLELYRIAQEALTNIAKHSQAKNVEISLGKRDDSVYLYVKDDGIGFDYEKYLKLPRRRKEDKLKLGLLGLRERMELLGGSLTVKTTPGKGTEIKAELNL